jgi:hypothetical protein
VAHDDQALLERALDRFTALELHWHAEQTPLLLAARSSTPRFARDHGDFDRLSSRFRP